jgi:flavin reductase (DIM6/NTAB) family NADH-FMN oxidoreductase RutF
MIGFLALSSNPSQTDSSRAAVEPSSFRRACARFATGVAVATCAGEDGTPLGLTVNSFSSVSLDPPLALVCIDVSASVHDAFMASNSFAVNILREEQQGLSDRFAFGQGDRFEGVEWTAGISGAPVLGGILAVLECETRERIPAGDHTIFVGAVVRAESRDGRPLLYYASEYRRLA